jgi:2-polyprenyl-3-methyl-5-hydroxy-6-metoxy-1,4-benzoquinol methylase
MCDSKLLSKTVSLTPTPPGNDFLTKAELGSYEPVYPLDLYFCEDCHHVQLGHVVNPKKLYQKNYTYVSATSPQFINHLKTYALDMIERFKLKSNDLVADIGSNDGTCLSFFKNQGLKVVGVDPAKEIASIANSKGIKTINDFFSFSLAKSILEEHGQADLITSHNTFAHIDQLDGIIRGIEVLLKNDGVFVFEKHLQSNQLQKQKHHHS